MSVFYDMLRIMTTSHVPASTRSGAESFLWLACLLGPVVALAAVDAVAPPGVAWSDLGSWLDTTSPETALAALAGVAVRAAALWVLASSIVAGVAVRWGRPWLTGAVLRLAAPVVRRLAVATAARLTAATLVVSPAIAPAVAVAVPPATMTPPIAADEPDRPLPPFLIVPGQLITHRHRPGREVPAEPGPSRGVVPPFLDDGHRPGSEGGGPARRRTATGPVTYTVASGDRLWSIARRRLAAATDGQPDQGAVARYWLRVVDANRHHIRSGDPDLIFPGEVIDLPPIGDV